MNKSAIKNFAIWARRKLIEDISQKAFEIGITESKIEDVIQISSDTVKVKDRILKKFELRQREGLVVRIKEKGYKEVIEEVAYTWFNRIIAIRFMEINEYMPTGVRVLSTVEHGKVEPDIISQVDYLDLDLDKKVVHRLQEEHNSDELYRYLLIKQCNKLNEILPGLFEELEDYTELLLPNNLLVEESVIRKLISDIAAEDFYEQVEIIGWMYQYYISEKKDEVFEGLKKNVKITKENIPAATQLFTPKWIVQYMIENSLGRLWLEGHPNDKLRTNWRYYLDEAEQELEVQEPLEEIRAKSKDLNPEEIKVLDPCMGSGHILVYAFDVLFDIYESVGYAERDIPKLILEKNLYGLDIDDRAAQLAYFALMMKARSKSRRIFRDKVNLNICSIQESNGFPKDAIEFLVCEKDTQIEKKIHKEEIDYLIKIFHDAKEYGSIIEVKEIDFVSIEERIEEIGKKEPEDIFALQNKTVISKNMTSIVKQGKILSQKYDIVVTNPPYMGSRSMNNKMKSYVEEKFKDTKSDLYSVFIAKSLSMVKEQRFVSLITQHSWLFLSSFNDFREKVLNNNSIISLVHLGSRAFAEIGGEVVQTVAFTLFKGFKNNYYGLYKRLVDYLNADEKEVKYFDKTNDYYSLQSLFENIPNKPIAYWVSDSVINSFTSSGKISDYGQSCKGMDTANNNKFLRLFWEVDINKMSTNIKDNKETEELLFKWFPYSKGGSFRKWYGNNQYIVNWENDGQEVKNSKSANIRNQKYFFRQGCTWSDLTSGGFGARYADKGFIFDATGPTLFPFKEQDIELMLGYINCNVFQLFLDITCQGLHYTNGIIAQLPFKYIKDTVIVDNIKLLVRENIEITKTDWDYYENSWNFKRHPLISYNVNTSIIQNSFEEWVSFTENQFNRLKTNEEVLNKVFIEIYKLSDVLVWHVDEKNVSIRKANRERDVKSFISYAVGCILGRYSIDAEGLIYAGGEWEEKWSIKDGLSMIRKIRKDDEGDIVEDAWVDVTFIPDEDNVIPILDDDYFEDDIVGRFIDFVKVTFGEKDLEENLNYIAETLNKKPSETSRQAIRRYFLKDFYNDHVKTYQKRPIYWLFDSGKQAGFKALIYMHRYDEFTVAKVRTDYLHKLQKQYDAEVKRIDILLDSNVSDREKANARKKKEKILKQMEECLQYDQVIAHIANQRISIDLDDGVSVNYAKFQGVEIPQGDGKKTLKADLLTKI